MREPMNFANAAVIIACMYFLISGEFGIWAKTPEQDNDGIDPGFDEATDLFPRNSIKTWKSVRLCGDYLNDGATPPDTGLPPPFG